MQVRVPDAPGAWIRESLRERRTRYKNRTRFLKDPKYRARPTSTSWGHPFPGTDRHAGGSVPGRSSRYRRGSPMVTPVVLPVYFGQDKSVLRCTRLRYYSCTSSGLCAPPCTELCTAVTPSLSGSFGSAKSTWSLRFAPHCARR